ncbi:BTB-domain-containing protein pipsqueak [Anticarsia gemmatalis]|uniref:BTB-domain-containing protein pipsqueak n=1 Tax=Anticarsia gemmatalis TaxID=129554 RepID=UPI003F7584CC
MPGHGTGHGLSQVKCEPPSDEEDSNSQFAHTYLSSQLTSQVHPVKLESPRSDDSVSTDILRDLQGSGLEELAPLAPAGPAATPVCVKQERASPPAAMLETLESAPHHAKTTSLLGRHMAIMNVSEVSDSADFMPLLNVKDEPSSEGEQPQLSGEDTSDSCGRQTSPAPRSSPKSWTQQDMERALDALRKHQMSLTKASATYGIPSTTLWQRAHRLGIDTPKKEGAAKSWSEADLRGALHALRAGAISANKASKAYGIPSSTLYKIARREGIRLSAPFNAAPTSWRRADLQLALASIRCGASSVQRAATTYGIPTGTLYGRCKREGIELSRSNPTPWSEDAMGEALEAVRVGQMSINQAAIHYNLPYSSLYGRFKRCKYQMQGVPSNQPPQDHQKPETDLPPEAQQYYHQVPPTDTHTYTHMSEYPHDTHMPEQYGQYYQTYGIATS